MDISLNHDDAEIAAQIDAFDLFTEQLYLLTQIEEATEAGDEKKLTALQNEYANFQRKIKSLKMKHDTQSDT